MDDVWVLTSESGSYSDYSMSVVAVAETADLATALGGVAMDDVHAALTARVMRYRETWPETRERWRSHHLGVLDRGGVWSQGHDPETCRECCRYRLSAEEAWPLPSPPPTDWTQGGGGTRTIEYDEDTWTVTRFPFNRPCQDQDGRRFAANPLNTGD
jgi:hypothetical protein